jgi:glutamyl-tRNA synthetase
LRHVRDAMPPTVRFAPSPTGLLHLGNARTAVVNWLFARQQAGRLVLRLDDTDRQRSSTDHETAIREDLAWLGVRWDEEHRQSERAALYEAAFERLRARGAVYPCFETAEELEARRRAQLARGEPPRYDRAALALGPAHPDRPPHWRFLLPAGPIAFTDLIRGPVEVKLASLSDPVIRREDGSATYLFASIVDDLDLGISHVIRGEDHLTNTGLQLALAQALNGTAPAFGHLPLVQDIAGGKLSKRLGSLSLRDLREEGIEPLAIVAVLATLGTGHAPLPDLDRLTRNLDLAAFTTSQPKLDPEALQRTSAAVLHAMPFAEAAARLALPGLDERFWTAVRPNLTRLADALDWWAICREPLAPVIEDAAFLAQAADTLPESVNEPEAVATWLKRLGELSGRRGRTLYHPLRLALTGREHGPELKLLLPLLGRDRASSRLRGQTA